MNFLSSSLLKSLRHDFDAREEELRMVANERLAASPPPRLNNYVVATYFLALRSKKLTEIGTDIAYHATSGCSDPPLGSLLEQCTGKLVECDEWDSTGRLGLIHMAFPLKMLVDRNGNLSSSDLLHITAGAILFDVYQNQDARLLWLTIPDTVVQTFPGPRYGPLGAREQTGFGPDEAAFGTILKPTAGITPQEVGELVGEAARCRLIMFVKEDENLFPRLKYSPVVERTRQAVEAIRAAQGERGDLGLIFAPHVTSAPEHLVETVLAVVEEGAGGIMFSETFAGGGVRMVREATKHLERPPMIYGHNAGIGTRTRCVWREVLDYLARLDGIDFRQTAPVRSGEPFIRPYGQEWEASEKTLTMDIPGIKPVMIARAGGLDQGNIIANLQDATERGRLPYVLLLAGSAINSIKDSDGKANPRLGAEAMQQALGVFQSGDLANEPLHDQVDSLYSLAKQQKLTALTTALRQRYPDRCS